MQGTTPSIPLVKVDNKSAISLIKNPVLTDKSRHIEIKYQLGDVLTKSLGKVKFQELHDRIGLIDVCNPQDKV
jgi:hypothetical protein